MQNIKNKNTIPARRPDYQIMLYSKADGLWIDIWYIKITDKIYDFYAKLQVKNIDKNRKQKFDDAVYAHRLDITKSKSLAYKENGKICITNEHKRLLYDGVTDGIIRHFVVRSPYKFTSTKGKGCHRVSLYKDQE